MGLQAILICFPDKGATDPKLEPIPIARLAAVLRRSRTSTLWRGTVKSNSHCGKKPSKAPKPCAIAREVKVHSVSEMQADGRGRARFLCGLALWMITVAAAHRHGANARMLHRRDTRSDCAGHGKFDCLDRRAPLRMLGGYRARRLARLHIRMLNDGDGGAALPAPTPWRRSQVPPDPHEPIAVEERRRFPCRYGATANEWSIL